MKTPSLMSRSRAILLMLILALLVVGCADNRRGVSWPNISVVTIGDQSRILVAYDLQAELLDLSGRIVPLLDANGAPVVNENNEARNWLLNGNAYGVADYSSAHFFATPLQTSYEGTSVLLFPTYIQNGRNGMLGFDTQTLQPVPNSLIELTDGVIGNVVEDEQNYYVPYRSRNLVAINRSTGTSVWQLDTSAGIWAAPLLENGILYVPSIDHKLYAVSAEDGTVLWTTDLEGSIASTPRYYEGYLYVGSYSHTLYKIDLDGHIVGTYKGHNWIWGTPAIFGNVVYFADLSGYVYALNTEDMSEVWVQQPAQRGIRPAPVVTEEHVIVASRSGEVYWLNRLTGQVVNTKEVEGRPELLSDMLVIAGATPDSPSMLLVGSTNTQHLLMAFNLQNSLPLWVYRR